MALSLVESRYGFAFVRRGEMYYLCTDGTWLADNKLTPDSQVVLQREMPVEGAACLPAAWCAPPYVSEIYGVEFHVCAGQIVTAH